MKINPLYLEQQRQEGVVTTIAQPDHALAVVSSPQDIEQAMQANEGMRLMPTATIPMETLQSEAYIDQFKAPGMVDGGVLADGLGGVFAKYEIPIGLMGKFLALSSFQLNFIIDDSGSMASESDVPIKTATDHTLKNIKERYKASGKTYEKTKHQEKAMTRWEEAEDRLHVMFSMLQYIPTNIRISFLNRPNVLTLTHDGKTPLQFAKDAHHQLRMLFVEKPTGGTPIYGRLAHELSAYQVPTMHYLLTDGCPSDSTPDQVAQLVIDRRNPQANPLTFLSCSNVDADTEWVKAVDEKALYTAELDDFISERREVLHDQGKTFPYSRGMWFLSQLVAAINPDDLDALDESHPLSKKTLDEILGRRTTPQEYQFYFQNHPNEKQYRNLFQQFAREDVVAGQILDPYGYRPSFFQAAQPGSYGMAPQPQQYKA